MTIERANQIVDGIAEVLKNPRLVAHGFKPLSRTSALSRVELQYATCIVVAQIFEAVSQSPDRATEFASFVRATESSLWHVLYSQPCLPDSELNNIAKLDEHSREFIKESIRLSELAQNDDTMKMETTESFVSYLLTLNPRGDYYWPSVYQRIGLDYSAAYRHPPKQNFPPSLKKSWWRFW